MSSEAEVQKLVESAKKHAHKSLFHKPDYNAAAEEYEKAAKFYTSAVLQQSNLPTSTAASDEKGKDGKQGKNSGLVELLGKAQQYWMETSECHRKGKNGFFAARSIQSLAQLYEELGNNHNHVGIATTTAAAAGPPQPEAATAYYEQAAQYYERAGDAYALEVKTEKKSECLSKAASMWRQVLKTCQGMNNNNNNNNNNTTALVTRAKKEYERLIQASLENMELSWEVDEKKPYKLPELYRQYIQQLLKDYHSAGNTVKKEDRLTELRAAVAAEKRLLGIVSYPQDPNNTVGRYDETKNVFSKLGQPTNAAKCGLEIIVLCLSSSDNSNDAAVWAAEEMVVLQQVTGFARSREENVCKRLITAFQDQDEEELQRTLKESHEINFIAPDIARMAKKLKLEPTETKKTTGISAPAAGGDEDIAAEDDMR